MSDEFGDQTLVVSSVSGPAERRMRIQRIVFFLTTVFCVAVPGFASLKALVLVLAWLCIGLTSRIHISELIWYASIVLSMGLCSEVSFIHGIAIADIVNHLSRFILFFLVLGMGIWVARSRAISRRNIDRLIVFIAILSAALKVAILTIVASGRVSLDAIQSALGFESVTDSIGFGIQRLQFPSDIILIFLLSCYHGRRKLTDLIFLLSITVGVFLSFSRYLFVAYVICLLIRFTRIRKLDLISVAAFSMSLLLLAFFSVSLASRFGGEGTRVSDNTRTEQIRYLSEAVSEYPLLGSGIGSSAHDYKRSDTIPFLYEVQWYAMAMQLGIIGLMWFFINLTIPFIDLLHSKRNLYFCIAVIAVWIAGGFTNPFVISLGSAFGLMVLMLSLLQEPTENAGVSHHMR